MSWPLLDETMGSKRTEAVLCGGLVIFFALTVSVKATESANSIEATTTSTTVTTPKPRPALREIACEDPSDCDHVDGSYCDVDAQKCLCKPDYPVTDTLHCYKESRYDEFCQLDIQCQRRDKNTKCNRDFNLCECQPRFVAQSYSNGQHYWCVEASATVTDTSVGSYVDPTLFGIMGGLALMFIVMCVVLRLFAKAQFHENRSIFNTPNPRLMNVSLLKERKLLGGRGDMAKNVVSSGGRPLCVGQNRRTSTTLMAAASAAVTATAGTGGGAVATNLDTQIHQTRNPFTYGSVLCAMAPMHYVEKDPCICTNTIIVFPLQKHLCKLTFFPGTVLLNFLSGQTLTFDFFPYECL